MLQFGVFNIQGTNYHLTQLQCDTQKSKSTRPSPDTVGMWHTGKKKYPTITRHSCNVTHRKAKVPDHHPTQLQCDLQESKSTRLSPDTVRMWHTGKQKYPTITRYSWNVTHNKAKVPDHHPTQLECDTPESKSIQLSSINDTVAMWHTGKQKYPTAMWHTGKQKYPYITRHSGNVTHRKSKAPHHYPTLLQFTYDVWHTGNQKHPTITQHCCSLHTRSDIQEVKSTPPLPNIAAVYIQGLTYRKSIFVS